MLGVSHVAAEDGILGTWPTEAVTLTDGRVYRGWVTSETRNQIRFRAVVRRDGKPLYTLGLELKTHEVARLDRLEPEARQQLLDEWDLYRRRTQAELEERERLTLAKSDELGPGTWRYRGPWFILVSTAEESIVRTAIVRIEQRCAALERLLPAETEPVEPMRIVLLGSRSGYEDYLHRLGVSVEANALYDRAAQHIIASSDLGRLTEEVERIRADHAERLDQLRAERDSLPELQRKEFEELRRAGAPSAAISQYQAQRSRHFRELATDLERRIREFERRNQTVLDEQMDQLFRTLYHELVHAYLENYVAVAPEHDVPTWLHEGLAQALQGVPLEGNVLRFEGSPERKPRAERLVAELESMSPLQVADVLTASDEQFLVTEGTSPEEVDRRYLYAWGLVDYLITERKCLSKKGLYALTRRDSTETPAERFEQLVGHTLDEFRPLWLAHLKQIAERNR